MPIVTISRGSQSGGVSLAERLHRILGYPLLSQEAVVEAAGRYGVDPDDIVRGLELPPSFWERLTHRKDRYILAMQATLAELVEGDGNGIYHGLAGQFLLQGVPCVFKIRLIAPMGRRVASAMESLGLSREEAERRIATLDERRVRWVRQLFDVDWHDPLLYDMVVNLDHVTVDTAAEAIAEVLRREDYRSSPECLEQVRNFALESRVRAELVFNSDLGGDGVEIRVRNGGVSLAGSSLASRRAEVVEFVRGVRGVRRVEVEGEEQVLLPKTSLGLGLSAEDQQAGDVMLPFGRYPTIHEDVSLRDAVVALTASAVKFEDGHTIRPRYLLVLDRADELVGIVSRRDLLKGLSPQYQGAERAEQAIRQLVPYGDAPYELLNWTSLFTAGAAAASRDPVRSVMGRVRGFVRPGDPLSTVVATMIREGVDLVPVLEGRRVAGVVLMTNIFDLVAEYIMEHGGRPPSP
jgi:CBS domain-containing protein